MPTHLTIQCAGSPFSAQFDDLKSWKAVLDCADAFGLVRDGAECIRVELGGLRRWIAFERQVGGSPLFAIGWQETVGAIRRDGHVIGGSNRKVIAWLHPSGQVHIE